MHTVYLADEVAVVELPWARPPLSLNDRLHPRREQEVIRNVRTAARELTTAVRFADRVDRLGVALVWLVETRHRRDSDNLAPTVKALCDGIVDAGLVPDDTPEYMHKAAPVIAYARGHRKAPGMFLILWAQDGPTEEEARLLRTLEDRLGIGGAA